MIKPDKIHDIQKLNVICIFSLMPGGCSHHPIFSFALFFIRISWKSPMQMLL